MIISDLSVAPFNIDAVSSISCIKVDTPRSYNMKGKKKLKRGLHNSADSITKKQRVKTHLAIACSYTCKDTVSDGN